MKPQSRVPILVVDDDRDDCEMIREAFQESRLINPLFFVHDGEELMEFLNQTGKFSDSKKFPSPGLILLDLNMPKKDGRECLIELKKKPLFCQIPVVILTTSQTEEDIFRTYSLGVNSFVTKPVAFNSLVSLIKELGHYWFEIVELPQNVKKKLL